MYGDIELGKDLQKLITKMDELDEYTDYLADVVGHNARAANASNKIFSSGMKWAGTGLIISAVLFFGLNVHNMVQDRKIEELEKRVEKLEKQDEPAENG